MGRTTTDGRHDGAVEEPAAAKSGPLAGPKSVNEVADLVSKMVFGFCTVLIAFAAFMLNRSVDEGNRRKELYTFLADGPSEASTPDQIRKVAFLRRVCRSYLHRVDDDGAEELCKALPEVGGKTVQTVSREAAPAAQQLALDGNAERYLATPQAAAQNSLVAAADTSVTPSTDQWFAVVGTVPVAQPDAARALADRIPALAPADVLERRPVRIYRTKRSNSLAITVGDAMSKDDAARLASKLRRVPALNDAFAQPNYDWTRVEEAPAVR